MAETRSPSTELDSVAVEEFIEEDDNQYSRNSPSPVSTIDDAKSEDCRSLWVSGALNIVCVLLYGYAIFYQNLDSQGALYNKILDPRIQPYGLWKYLTYNSLWMQFSSCCLHLLASIFPKYRIVRDSVFTTLSYPIGLLVVCTFWIIWWTQGREQIYPAVIEMYYPNWLNHVTHSMVAPINIAQAYLTFHRYIKRGSAIPVLYMVGYCIYGFYIRVHSGIFVYPYLNRMNKISIAIYTASVLFCTLASYESGSFLTSKLHNRKISHRSHAD